MLRFAPLLAAVLGLLPFTPLQADLQVSLNPSIPSPLPVGTLVTWNATPSDASAPLWYRFRARPVDADFHVVRDYGPGNTLQWTASEHDGNYEIEVSALNPATGETALATVAYQFTSRVSGNSAVVNPTAHPLVFLYSAPPCASESRMRVQFQSPDGWTQYTPYQPCKAGASMNFYLAGLRPNSSYTAKHTVDTGFAFLDSDPVTFTVPSVSMRIPGERIRQQAPAGTAGLLLHSGIVGPSYATDLGGNLLWYYPGRVTFLTRPEPGGFFWSLIVDPVPDPSRQILREFDLTGMTVRETNAARIDEQLDAMGVPRIGAFHHAARSLPDGKVLVLASTERILTDVQGPGPVDVLGDMILVLDRDLQVLWTWNSFDHLDPARAASLGETCTAQIGGCPPLYLAAQANDWLHGNALQFTPDGNILYSSRHQDWIVKIDYSEKTGNILWRLGNGGDFQLNAGDPTPWFSHQHGPELSADGSQIAVLDNGNLRRAVNANAHSRGQVLQLDEQDRTASLVVNADLGGFSYAMGAAQVLPDGTYHFAGGWLPDYSNPLLEVDASGNPFYQLQTAAPEYRVFRMRDLYTP